MTMKTVVSLNDDLVERADEAARQMGLSRSRFFAAAISEFPQKRKQEMLHRLNQVYAEGISPDDKDLLKGMKFRVRRLAERE